MSIRVCAAYATQIDELLTHLRSNVERLNQRKVLVRNVSDYKSQLKAENAKLKAEVASLKRQLTDLEVMSGKKCYSLPDEEPPPQVEAQKQPVVDLKPQPVQQNKQGTGNEQQKKQPKKKAQKANNAQKAQNQPSEAQKVDVSRLDMRVGFIRTAKLHPDADGLYLEEIDCGEPEPRQVISGLVKHIPMDAMQGRPCVLLCNLKPAKMRGIISYAMVMCASSPENVEILVPPAGSKPGDKVTVEGFTGTPDQQLNPKKKVFEAIQPDFLVSTEGHALYKGVQWLINGQPVTAPSMRNCEIR